MRQPIPEIEVIHSRGDDECWFGSQAVLAEVKTLVESGLGDDYDFPPALDALDGLEANLRLVAEMALAGADLIAGRRKQWHDECYPPLHAVGGTK